MKIHLIVILLMSLFFLSCSHKPTTKAVLYTDIPEIVSLVEDYNLYSPANTVEFHYIDNIYSKEASQSDILISRNLEANQFDEIEYNLSFLIEIGSLDSSLFYQDLFNEGKVNEKQILIPLNFNLPVLTFLKDTNLETELNSLISFDEIKTLSIDMNKRLNNALTTVGYSPNWSGAFVYSWALLNGINFRLDNGLEWEQEQLDTTLDLCSEWIQSNGGVDSISAFNNKYRYDTDFNLLESKRILFSFSTLSDFMNIPTKRREDYTFLYPTNTSQIATEESTIFLALKNVEKNQVSTDFCKWILSAENQNNIILSMQDKRIDQFGFLNGLSSIRETNLRYIPQLYPDLLGFIPPENFILFPGQLPSGWKEFKEDLFFPWLERALLKEESVSASEIVTNWYLQNQNVRADHLDNLIDN